MGFGGFMMKKVLLALPVFLFCAFFASARDDLPPPEDREVPPAPVVSDLRAELSGVTVTLTWTPAPDVSGDNVILRSDKPISAANFTEAQRIATVPSAQTSYQDTIEGGKSYYYAILSRDDTGAYYEFFVPTSNSLLVAVSASGPTVDSSPEVFSAFDAITRDDAVLVTWKSETKGRNVILYRSTAPFTGMESLVQAVLVSAFTDDGSPFVDYPVPGVPYFYAILDEATVRSGTVAFSGGANTNATPVEIAGRYLNIQKPLLSTVRPMPLPWLNPENALPVPARGFSPRTETMIKTLAQKAKPDAVAVKEPFIFRSDREAASGGEDFALKQILETGFTAKDWKGTITSLERFLMIRRGEDTTARTRFYIGEACFFSGDYDRSLKEFLLARDAYYTQSNEWIQYVLDRMVAKGEAR
jgi:hypothetical protein